MIRFRITSVNRKTSSEVDTIRFTYKNDQRTHQRVSGAEWEEVEFTVVENEQPAIQIANITGDALLVGQGKLLINDPGLFGTYKSGDIIDFIPNGEKWTRPEPPKGAEVITHEQPKPN